MSERLFCTGIEGESAYNSEKDRAIRPDQLVPGSNYILRFKFPDHSEREYGGDLLTTVEEVLKIDEGYSIHFSYRSAKDMLEGLNVHRRALFNDNGFLESNTFGHVNDTDSTKNGFFICEIPSSDTEYMNFLQSAIDEIRES